jgi:L-alanine-DL-glutamate epimerase-like enolase superfamily enzyme
MLRRCKMKIEKIELQNVLIPMAASGLPNSVGRNYGAYMLVRVKCDNGLEGFGEGYYGNATSAVAAIIRDVLAPEIIGQEATNINSLYERMYRAGYYFGRVGLNTFAIGVLEIALWDIVGKHLGAPIYSLLGGTAKEIGPPHPTLRFLFHEVENNIVPVYGSLQPYRTSVEAAAAAVEAVKAGFKSVKLHQVDLESVKTTREAVGKDIEITIDPTGYFNPLEAERFAKSLAEYNVGWLEEPIWPPDDYPALARLRNRSPVAIAGGENEFTIWGFERILEAEAVDILQPDVLRLGGIMESVKVYSKAQSRNILIAPHNFRYGPVLAASAHLSLVFSNVIALETPWVQLEANLLKDGPEISQGHIKLTKLPGLGIIVDEDVVKEYRVEIFPRK